MQAGLPGFLSEVSTWPPPHTSSLLTCKVSVSVLCPAALSADLANLAPITPSPLAPAHVQLPSPARSVKGWVWAHPSWLPQVLAGAKDMEVAERANICAEVIY